MISAIADNIRSAHLGYLFYLEGRRESRCSTVVQDGASSLATGRSDVDAVLPRHVVQVGVGLRVGAEVPAAVGVEEDIAEDDGGHRLDVLTEGVLGEHAVGADHADLGVLDGAEGLGAREVVDGCADPELVLRRQIGDVQSADLVVRAVAGAVVAVELNDRGLAGQQEQAVVVEHERAVAEHLAGGRVDHEDHEVEVVRRSRTAGGLVAVGLGVLVRVLVLRLGLLRVSGLTHRLVTLEGLVAVGLLRVSGLLTVLRHEKLDLPVARAPKESLVE